MKHVSGGLSLLPCYSNHVAHRFLFSVIIFFTEEPLYHFLPDKNIEPNKIRNIGCLEHQVSGLISYTTATEWMEVHFFQQ